MADPARTVIQFNVTARSRAREDLLWYMRHADALARWPVIPEQWAQHVEQRRLNPHDEGPGRPTTAA